MAKQRKSKGRKPLSRHNPRTQPSKVAKSTSKLRIQTQSQEKVPVNPPANVPTKVHTRYTAVRKTKERQRIALDEYLQTALTNLGREKDEEIKLHGLHLFHPDTYPFRIWNDSLHKVQQTRRNIVKSFQNRKKDDELIKLCRAKDERFASNMAYLDKTIDDATKKMNDHEYTAERHKEMLSLYAMPVSPITVKQETDYIKSHVDEAARLKEEITALTADRKQRIEHVRDIEEERDAAFESMAQLYLRPTERTKIIFEVDRLFAFWKSFAKYHDEAIKTLAERAKYSGRVDNSPKFDVESRECENDVGLIKELYENVKDDIKAGIGSLYTKGLITTETPQRIEFIHNAISKGHPAIISRITPAKKLPLIPKQEVNPVSLATKSGNEALPTASSGSKPATSSEWIEDALNLVEINVTHVQEEIEAGNEIVAEKQAAADEAAERLERHVQKSTRQDTAALGRLEAEERAWRDWDARTGPSGSRVEQLEQSRMAAKVSNETIQAEIEEERDRALELLKHASALIRFYTSEAQHARLLFVMIERRRKRDATIDGYLKEMIEIFDQRQDMRNRIIRIFHHYVDGYHPVVDQICSILILHAEEYENASSDINVQKALAIYREELRDFQYLVENVKTIDQQYHR